MAGRHNLMPSRKHEACPPLEGLPAVNLAGDENTKEEGVRCFRDEWIRFLFFGFGIDSVYCLLDAG